MYYDIQAEVAKIQAMNDGDRSKYLEVMDNDLSNLAEANDRMGSGRNWEQCSDRIYENEETMDRIRAIIDTVSSPCESHEGSGYISYDELS